MDWNDTPEQIAFRTEVRAFIDEHLPDYYRRIAESEPKSGYDAGYDWMADRKSDNPEVHDAAWSWTKALAERGWLAPQWPKEYGGAGLSVWEMMILNQELGSSGAPAVGGQGVTQIGPALIVHGSDEQRATYLPKILAGDIAWCQGYSEPGAGSDLASLQTRATRDGDEYVINGQKIWTSGAHHADAMYLLARTDPSAPKHRGISFLIIDDVNTEGLTIRPLVTAAWGFGPPGKKSHGINETFFEEVRIPAKNIVGDENRGWYVGMTLLDYERANIDGAVRDREALVETIEYAASDDGREQSRINGDVGSATIRADVADQYLSLQVAENLSLRVASMQAAGGVPNYESSVGKLFGSEVHQRLQRLGTRVFGLYANIWDPDHERAPMHARFSYDYIRAIPSTIAGGSSEIQRNIIATRGLGLPRG